MNWDAVGALAELLAATGVIASLIFVGLQVRQNTDVAKANTRQAIADAAQRWALSTVNSADISRIVVTMRAEPSSLTDAERFQWRQYQRANIRFFENVFFQYRKGLIEQPEWSGYRRILGGALLQLSTTDAEYFPRLMSGLPPEFVEEAEQALEDRRASEENEQ